MADFLLFRGLAADRLPIQSRVSICSARLASSLLGRRRKDAQQSQGGETAVLEGDSPCAVSKGLVGSRQVLASDDEDWLWASMLSLGRD